MFPDWIRRGEGKVGQARGVLLGAGLRIVKVDDFFRLSRCIRALGRAFRPGDWNSQRFSVLSAAPRMFQMRKYILYVRQRSELFEIHTAGPLRASAATALHDRETAAMPRLARSRVGGDKKYDISWGSSQHFPYQYH